MCGRSGVAHGKVSHAIVIITCGREPPVINSAYSVQYNSVG